MRTPTILMYCIGAFALGGASPLIANAGGDFSDPASQHGLFYAWFYVLPAMVDQWFLPEGDILMVALAVVVFTVQYLAVLGVLVALWRLAIFTRDFVSPSRHRGRLVRRG